jgi:very-short-patch-repair endonuclease
MRAEVFSGGIEDAAARLVTFNGHGLPLPLVGRGGAEGAGVGFNGWNRQMPHSAITTRTRLQAQSLRRRPTDAERKLWYVLRSMKPLGIHFRRQAPVGAFIVDFVWHAGKLVVEIDGSQHAELQRDYDERWTAWLQSQSYRVLRFWNNDVLRTPRAVGETILAAARDATLQLPTPIPSPRGGGEEFATPPGQQNGRTAVGEHK